MRTCLFFAAAITAVFTGCSPENRVKLPPGTMPPAAEKADVTYAADIKPIFDAACIECHGAKKQKAGLRLDSREATVHGGEEGPVFEIGKSAESSLAISTARTGEEDHWMPPVDKGKSLTLEQVALIRAWIDQGAK